MGSILIAEDESRIAAFIAKGLQKNGFTTAIAPDGAKVLEMMQNNGFDLILLDLGLPVKDGWTVLQELRSQGHKIPIIVVSAYDRPEADSGITDFVAKPFSFRDLLSRVNFYLQQT